MDEIEITKKLTEMGGKLWEKGSMRRIYFDASVWGLEISRYNSGNICGASLNGESISNSEAYRCDAVKVWYDLADGKFYAKNTDNLQSKSRDALVSFFKKAL